MHEVVDHQPYIAGTNHLDYCDHSNEFELGLLGVSNCLLINFNV